MPTTEQEPDKVVKEAIKSAQLVTVISWCTYPVVYLFPMLGISASKSVVGIQIGYCFSDIISKCGVGLLIYQITMAKSATVAKGMEEPLVQRPVGRYVLEDNA